MIEQLKEGKFLILIHGDLMSNVHFRKNLLKLDHCIDVMDREGSFFGLIWLLIGEAQGAPLPLSLLRLC